MPFACFFSAGCLLPAAYGGTQGIPGIQTKPGTGTAQASHPAPTARPKPPQPETAEPVQSNPDDQNAVLPGDWGPELLYAMLSSPNPDASEALYDAAFASGRAIIPQLQAALKDDRTAEFAAQCLAYMGGGDALKILAGLIGDPRDLDLRRFYFGALGEYHAPEATKILLYALDHSDHEPDRTVTEAAILALTVRSDTSLVPLLEQAKTNIHDVVISDDLDNAIDVIRLRSKYLASPEGKRAGGSIHDAVRTYFMPAIESAPKPVVSSAHAGSHAAAGHEADSGVKFDIQSLTFSPDKTRALAHVSLEGPAVLAYYDMVLQKEAGDWAVVSVWLGPEIEKPPSPTTALKPR